MPSASVPSASLPPESLGHRISAFFYRHPRARTALFLTLPAAWLGIVYIGSLLALVLQSFYRLDEFTGTIDRSLSFDTWGTLFTAVTRDTVLRTVAMALAVTTVCATAALPIGYFMAKVASGRLKSLLYVAVLMPLWASYIVRVYSWRQILSQEGVLSWFARRVSLGWVIDGALGLPGIGGPDLVSSFVGQFLVFVYIWLPYMILPIQAALERVPSSLLDASADLGARPVTTFRRVVWPLAIPGVAAGSIFTFSLTMGDYIIPTLVGPSKPSIGLSIYQFQGVAGNLPLAAAYTVIPIAIMGLYLVLARRLGAFEAL